MYDIMNGSSTINVLLVGDTAFFTDIIIRMLKRSGLNVNCNVVKNKTALQAKLQEADWDILVSADIIPGFSALGALAIRNDMHRKIPFVIVSEDISDKELKDAFDWGCSAALPKDEIAKLPDLIRQLLANGNSIR